MRGLLKSWLKSRGIGRLIPHEYHADGMALHGKNLAALDEPAFAAAYREAERLNLTGWKGAVPDIRFRAHVCCWAAKNALKLRGDFVECGVHTGLLSLTVAHYLDFAKLDRTMWLFDTFEGIPLEQVSGKDREHAAMQNEQHFFDCFAETTRSFAPYPNAKLVRGRLPESLAEASIDSIAYLSMDLNNAQAEMATIELLWPKLLPGAIVVLDDYAFAAYATQHVAWDEFAARKRVSILTLPTGQGIILKPLNQN